MHLWAFGLCCFAFPLILRLLFIAFLLFNDFLFIFVCFEFATFRKRQLRIEAETRDGSWEIRWLSSLNLIMVLVVGWWWWCWRWCFCMGRPWTAKRKHTIRYCKFKHYALNMLRQYSHRIFLSFRIPLYIYILLSHFYFIFFWMENKNRRK